MGKDRLQMERRDKNGLTEQEFLAAYRPGDYERPSLTADVAVFSVTEEKTRLLLIRRGGHPYLGCWALPGGFANPGEPVERTAARELEEETGLSGLPFLPVGLFGEPGRDPRMWVVSQAFAAVIPEERRKEVRAGDDAAAARWFDVYLEREGGRVKLTFSSDEERFFALLQLPDIGACTAGNKPQILNRGELAFDHAAVIGQAMRKVGLL